MVASGHTLPPHLQATLQLPPATQGECLDWPLCALEITPVVLRQNLQWSCVDLVLPPGGRLGPHSVHHELWNKFSL